jgi:hypothetical protein
LSLSLSALSLFPQFLRVSFPFVTFTRGKRWRKQKTKTSPRALRQQ